jgi:hypothetical protein
MKIGETNSDKTKRLWPRPGAPKQGLQQGIKVVFQWGRFI